MCGSCGRRETREQCDLKVSMRESGCKENVPGNANSHLVGSAQVVEFAGCEALRHAESVQEGTDDVQGPTGDEVVEAHREVEDRMAVQVRSVGHGDNRTETKGQEDGRTPGTERRRRVPWRNDGCCRR